jgi:hypothetical protein
MDAGGEEVVYEPQATAAPPTSPGAPRRPGDVEAQALAKRRGVTASVILRELSAPLALQLASSCK